jgi:hypothetical protein
MKPSIENIHSDILSSYGPPESPNWGFVGKRHNAAPYAAVVSALRSLAQIKDETDLNDDVGLWLELSFPEPAQTHCGLCLSYVGPYAVLYRHGGPVLSQESTDLSHVEASVLRILVSLRLFVLNKDQLELPYPMGLNLNSNPQDVRLFHILFSDSYGLPGQWPAVIDQG